jgi:hypothetical protein
MEGNIDRKKVNNQVLYADINNTIIQDNSFISSISLKTSFPHSSKEKNPKPRNRKIINSLYKSPFSHLTYP